MRTRRWHELPLVTHQFPPDDLRAVFEKVPRSVSTAQRLRCIQPLDGTKAPRNSENLYIQNTSIFRTPRYSTTHTNDKKITTVEAHVAMTLGEFFSVAGAVAQGDFDPGAVIRD
jgi:hypothetical protein